MIRVSVLLAGLAVLLGACGDLKCVPPFANCPSPLQERYSSLQDGTAPQLDRYAAQ